MNEGRNTENGIEGSVKRERGNDVCVCGVCVWEGGMAVVATCVGGYTNCGFIKKSCGLL